MDSARPIIAIIASALMLIGASASSHAETYYVKERGGRDRNPGTEKAPWKSLQHAAKNVAPGDTIQVLPGVYEGFWMEISGRPDARIRFLGEPGVIIDRGTSLNSRDNINIEGASYVDIEGFEITSAWRAGIRAVECKHVRIRNNHVHHNGQWGIFTGFCDDLMVENNVVSDARRQHGIYVSNTSKRPIVRGNHVFNNGRAGIHMNGDASMGREGMIFEALVENNLLHDNGDRGGAAINADGIRDSVIRNNIMYDNHANGITIYRIDGAEASSNNLIAHNTIWMPTRARWCFRIYNGAKNIRILNNICINERRGRGAIDIDDSSLPGLISQNNSMAQLFTTTDGESTIDFAAWKKRSGQDTDSITATPEALFVDPAGRDLRLRPDSPALDRGAKLPEIKHDYFGNGRSVGKAADLGAVEHCQGSACKSAYSHAGPPLAAANQDNTAPAAGHGTANTPQAATASTTAANNKSDEDPKTQGQTAAAGQSTGTVSPANSGCCRSQAAPETPISAAVLSALWLIAYARRWV